MLVKKSCRFIVIIFIFQSVVYMNMQIALAGTENGSLLNSNSCSIITNESMEFEHKMSQNIWFNATAKVINAAFVKLKNAGFSIHEFILDPGVESNGLELITDIIKIKKCKKIIEIIHVKNSSSEFGYNVNVLSLEKSRLRSRKYNQNGYTLRMVYSKKYRYPLSMEIFKTLSLTGIGNRAASDIIKSNVLSN